MKKPIILNTIMVLSLLLLILSGCKKDPAIVAQDPPLGLQEPKIAGVMMTLSAISYVAEKLSPEIIRGSIDLLLRDKTLATKGLWKRVWGPGVVHNTANNANLVFVASINTQPVPSYAIVIRGTNFYSGEDYWQDFNISLAHFKYGQTSDSVSQGAMDGLDSLLLTTNGGLPGATLEAFLDSIKNNAKIPLFVTGHSQGGYLAPLMAYWVKTNTKFTDKFILRTLTFAAPGVVNEDFKNNFKMALSPGDSIQMFVNSMDVIPYYWTDLPGLIVNKIPVALPDTFSTLLIEFQHALDSLKIKYYNIQNSIPIGFLPVGPRPSFQNHADSINYYKKWAEAEHNHNNYLYLLGEPPLPF